MKLHEVFDGFSRLAPYVQLALVLGFITLLVLIAINPTIGVGISSFLLALKALFGNSSGSKPRGTNIE